MFQSTLLLEGAFCGGKGYKKEKVGGDAHIAPPKQHLRSVLFSAAMSKPSGGIRSLPSLSACGLPTPVVALACICDVDIRVFSGAGVSILPPLKGVTPHGVGRCPQGRGDRSVRGGPAKLVEGLTREVYFLVQPCRNRPAEFARCPRCPPGACQRRLLPLPVLVMLIFKCFLVQVGDFISYGVCKFICLSSFMYNRFHKELRFFFSLLKRKKEAKKEKSSRSTCTVRFQYHPKIIQRIFY